MVGGADPCSIGLTPKCFKARPQHAKQVFAIRLLEAMTGLEYMKRLQKMIGVPLPEGVTELMAGLPEVTVPPGVFSALSPLYLAPWEPGPTRTSQSTQEEDAVPAIHKAVINIETAATHEIVAAVAGFKISIASIAFTVAGETNLTLCSGATPISGAMDFGGTNEPRGLTHAPGEYSLQTAAGEAFQIINSVAIQVSGYVTYYLS